MQGRIIKWNDDRGFGFIEPESAGQQVFFHISDFARGRRPMVGESVRYRVSKASDGKVRATGVRRTGATAVAGQLGSKRVALSVIALGTFVALWWLVQQRGYPHWLPWAYGAVSAITFVFYGLDKWAAKRGAQRTPESTLQGLALAGGWPGALLAQQVFRHKSSKPSFQITFWFVVGLNCIALLWAPEWLPGQLGLADGFNGR
ncbi:DUF1294 domain-containing protein [Marinihelvus fidelis]|uniref:DUF1294 domain-containing protein n=1 Tax=Marinihelvus fidelis TaxID=2613842 RepID=A0A5N0T3K1_9GAMM|nr:cold shock and DUF1294 domain-containing protein [Marinihelvus fidelis]KAA9129650.1 DUF1294 domain-containing protein [Marinihelvus fidelis]